MNKELELWQFVASRLRDGEAVMLLVVTESTGSSPGRKGYKMAVSADGELYGSIGGGVMEVKLVEQSRAALSEPGVVSTGSQNSVIMEQVHRKNAPNASGMICSGRQTVVFKRLNAGDSETIETIITGLNTPGLAHLNITPDQLSHGLASETPDDYSFVKTSDIDFAYKEKLGPKNDLYIVGGGHSALALSELMSRMDFHIRIFDDRPDLNTIEKNRFADEFRIIDTYESVGGLIRGGSNVYVVVMTLGYASDEVVIRQLIAHELKYFGVLGSQAKMKTLFTALEKDGVPKEKLALINTPIGLPINSHTPEEIAVSIAAEIIAVKNAQ